MKELPANNSKGFSLIELIIITAVVGLIILVLANVPASLGLIGGSSHESLAKQIAQQSIENARVQTYSNLANNIPGGIPITDTRISELPRGSGTLFIQDCPGTICASNERIKQVTASISWFQNQTTKTITLVTFISEGGLH